MKDRRQQLQLRRRQLAFAAAHANHGLDLILGYIGDNLIARNQIREFLRQPHGRAHHAAHEAERPDDVGPS